MITTKKLLLGVLGSVTLVVVANAMVVKYNTNLVNEVGLTSNKTYPLNLNSYGIDNLSFTTTLSSVSFTNQTFTDGQESTGTITVSTTSGLAAISASDSLTIGTTTIPAAAALTVNGVVLTNGLQWFADNTTTATAINIRNAIVTYVPNVLVSTGGGSQVFSTATVAGAYGNNMTFVSNVSTSVISFATYTSSGSTGATSFFSGGTDAAMISINGITIPFTTTLGVGGSSTTASSIAAGINANTFLKAIVIASTGGAVGTVVTATSTQVGLFTNYIITSSTDAALTVGGSTKTVTGLNGASRGLMWGGLDSAMPIIFPATTTIAINITTHNYVQGLAVLLSTTGVNQTNLMTSITPLTNQTTYYVIPLTGNSIALARSSTDSVNGIPIVITSSQTRISADSFTLTPLAITGVPSFKWEISNDGTNWYPYSLTANNVAISTVGVGTYISTGTVNTWDFGPIDYAYIRLNVISPTQGAVKLQVTGSGKNTGQFQ